MWLVAKDTTGKTGRVAIGAGLRAALGRWYTGRGSEVDHRASVSLVVTARENHKWLACDCRGEDSAPPLLSPAYLSFQETYYLRRLTSRPMHHADCPFFLPQAPPRIRETAKDALSALDVPDRLFNAHHKAPEKLAQKSVGSEPNDRSRGIAIPRLGKLLWLLLERAGANILRELPPTGPRAGSIGKEMRRLRRAALGLEIAPGIRLSDHLYTTVIDYERRRVHARLRAAAEAWPDEFAPQAFLLLEASALTSSEIVTGLGTVSVRNPIQHAGIVRAEIDPPFLVLAVVGEHSRKEGYTALRAYAQPVFTGNQFVPTERGHDREVLRALQQAQYVLRRQDIRMAVKKILFDVPRAEVSARPDFLVALLDDNTGQECRFALQILQSPDLDHRELRATERDRLALFGPVTVLAVGEVTPAALVDAAHRYLARRKGGEAG